MGWNASWGRFYSSHWFSISEKSVLCICTISTDKWGWSILERRPALPWLTYERVHSSTCITSTIATCYMETEILEPRGGKRRCGGCLPSRLGNGNEKLRQAFSEANLWLSGQHGLLPMTIWFLDQQTRWGRGSACISPMRQGWALCPLPPSPLLGVSLSWVWGCGVELTFEKQNPDVLMDSCWPLLAGSCGVCWAAVGFCKVGRPSGCVTHRVFTKG